MLKRWVVDALIGAGLFAGLCVLILFAAGRETGFMYAFF